MIHKAFPAKVFTKVVIGCSWVEDSGFRAGGVGDSWLMGLELNGVKQLTGSVLLHGSEKLSLEAGSNFRINLPPPRTL